MTSSIDRAVAELARSQLGMLNRRQLREIGVHRNTVTRWVEAGRLERVGVQTFRVAAVPMTFRGRIMAACLDVEGVASHRTSAWLHGAEGFGPPRVIEVSTAKDRTHRTSSARVHQTTNLAEGDVVLVDGIPTMSVARTVLGLSALVPQEVARERAVGATEAFVRERKASMRWLWWFLEERRCRGRDGVTVMEGILAELDSLGPTESWLERTTLRLIERKGLPRPAQQSVLRRRGAFVSRVDFVWDAQRVVVEVEGKTHLTATQQSVDARQRAELQLLGYRVLTFNYGDVTGDPGRVADTIERALALGRSVA